MGSVTQVTWIEKLEEWLNVDVDTMDPAFPGTLPIKPHNQTSNQLITSEHMLLPENREMFLQAVRDYKDQGWQAVHSRVSAQLCAKNIGNLQGRVLLQTSPSYAYDTNKVVEHAREYARELEKVGIGKDRLCIKIPCTGPAMNAGPILLQDGIRTLGTSLFSLAQAIAASQAGCLYISPYYNGAWKSPGFALISLRLTYSCTRDRGQGPRRSCSVAQCCGSSTTSSFISPQEAMAAGEMGCHHATISPEVLTKLAALPYDQSKQPGEGIPKSTGYPYANAPPTPTRLAKLSKIDPLAPAGWDGKLASTDIDYLANNGAELQKAIEADPETKKRLFEALELFKGGEMRSKAAIEEAMKLV